MSVSTPSIKTSHPRLKKGLIVVGVMAAMFVALIMAASVLSGYGLNVRGFAGGVANLLRGVRDHQAIVSNTGDYKNVVFLHHSVGHNLIEQGAVRELIHKSRLPILGS